MADTQKRAKSDGLARLDALPVADPIAKRNHIFLAVAGALPRSLDAEPQGGKEFLLDFGVYGQQLFCTVCALN